MGLSPTVIEGHMRRIGLLLGLSLWIHAAMPAVLPPEPATPVAELAPTDPTETPLKMLRALRTNDFAGLLEATGGEEELRRFLTDDAAETPQTVAEKIANSPVSDEETQFLGLWTTLAGPDGVTRASAEWYPRWQANVPQMLAGAQMGLAAMGASIAEDTGMTALERAQLVELQFALSGWLSRTDFSDRSRFEQLLALAREWILASGKAHPFELVLTTPEQRLALATRAMQSTKRALNLYGIDAEQVLASVKFELLAREPDRARMRTSFKFLDVPLALEQDLAWYQDEWMPAESVQAARDYDAAMKAEEAAAANAPPGTVALDGEPVFGHPQADQD